MSQSSLRLRRVTEADIIELLGERMDPEFCIGTPVGYAADRNGRVVAYGIVTWCRYARAWGWFERREDIPAIVMHRYAKEMLKMLRDAGQPSLYAICSPIIPGAAKWLSRLGFVKDTDLVYKAGDIYRADLLV